MEGGLMEPVGERSALTTAPTRLAITAARPAVAAGEDPGHGLPVDAVDRVWAAVDASTSAATKAAYRSDWARFSAWAAAGGHALLPASPMLVAAYLTEAAGSGRLMGGRRSGPRR